MLSAFSCGAICAGRAIPEEQAPTRGRISTEQLQIEAGGNAANSATFPMVPSEAAVPAQPEPVVPAKPGTFQEKLQATADKAAELKTAAHTKAVALKEKIPHRTAGTGPSKPGASDHRQHETLTVSHHFVTWLTGGVKPNEKSVDDSRQTILKTVQSACAVQISIDPKPTVLGQKTLTIIGDVEQSEKAKSMLMDLASRCQADSLEGTVDAWNDMGGHDDNTSFSKLDNFQTGNPAGNSRGYDGHLPAPPRLRSGEESIATLRRTMMAQDVRNAVMVTAGQKPLQNDECDEDLEGFGGNSIPLSREGTALLNQQLNECMHALHKVQRRDGSANQLLAVLDRMSFLPVSAEALEASGAFKELQQDFVRNHPDARVREAVYDLLLKWKELLAYSPGFEFDNTLNSFTAQSTHRTDGMEQPALWKEDKFGGIDLQLGSSPLSPRRGNEAERSRVASVLRSNTSISAVESSPLDANSIMFRVENSENFCEFMGRKGVVLERDEYRDKGVLAHSFGQSMAQQGVGVLRDRGPNDYVNLRLGSASDNDRFLSFLAHAEHAATNAAQQEAFKSNPQGATMNSRKSHWG